MRDKRKRKLRKFLFDIALLTTFVCFDPFEKQKQNRFRLQWLKDRTLTNLIIKFQYLIDTEIKTFHFNDFFLSERSEYFSRLFETINASSTKFKF